MEPVQTFEALDTRLEPVATAESLAVASQALPRGVYTTLRTYGGHRVIGLDLHVRRLAESAALVGTPSALSEESVRLAIAQALRRCRHPESRLRLTFSPPRLFVSIEPFEALPDSLYRDGARCATLRLHRWVPAAKDTRFIARAVAERARLPPGCEEGLMVDQDGAILEGLSSNFFALRNGVLHADGDRVLQGTTRKLALEAAEGVITVASSPVFVSELARLAECFLTSTSRGVLPVVRIDAVTIGDGHPGPITRRIAAGFAQIVEREVASVLG